MNINFDELQRVSRPVSVSAHAFDADSGKEITNSVKFSVIVNGKYVPLETAQKNFSSGKILKILAEARGYKTQEFSMIVDWFQDTVFVGAQLKKE